MLATCTTLFVDDAGAGTPRLLPEAAAAFPSISNDGLTYVFTIRPGLRFADGSPLTAAAYARAIGRVSIHACTHPLRHNSRPRSLACMRSEPAHHPVVASAWRPDLAPDDAVGLPGSSRAPDRSDRGRHDSRIRPYTIVEHLPGRELVLRRNAFYRGPRPQRPGTIDITIGGTARRQRAAIEQGAPTSTSTLLSPQSKRRRRTARRPRRTLRRRPPPVLHSAHRLDGVPRDEYLAAALPQKRALRRAINYALDRPEIIRQGFPLAGRKTDQLLPAATLGARNDLLYPLGGPDLRTARRLARGHLRGGKAVLYIADAPVALRRAAIIRYDLAQIGLDVQVRAFARAVLLSKVSTRGEPFDLTLTGWTGFTLDPADFLVRLLDGRAITTRDNFNLSYFDVPGSTSTAATDALPAPQRYDAFASLETQILRRYAPVAPPHESACLHPCLLTRPLLRLRRFRRLRPRIRLPPLVTRARSSTPTALRHASSSRRSARTLAWPASLP